MADEEVSIYVLPNERGKPVRAVIGDDNPSSGTITGLLVFWSADIGTWVSVGDTMPLEPAMAEALTAAAKDLGIEW